MEIRQLIADDFDRSADLGEYAFGYKLSAEERERRRSRFKPEQVWGAWDGEELQARLVLLPLELYVGGNAIPMGGIAGVCTWPEQRRKGLVRRLLQQALTVMKEQGQSLSCLHPFLVPFYRRFGWEIYTEYKKYRIPVPVLGVSGKFQEPGTVRRGIRDLGILAPLYETFAKRYNGTLVRSAEWWENSVFDADMFTAVYYSEGGTAEGYLLYKITGQELTVDEIVYLNETARRGLWEFLNHHDSKVTEVVVDHVPSDDLLPYLLNDPRCKQEVWPYFMARIVDAAAFVEQYRFEAPVDPEGVTLTLSLQDEAAEWNDGRWTLHIDADGQGRLFRSGTPEQGDESAAAVSCDIQSLAAMLLGYKRPLELSRAERISGSPAGIAALERVIPQRGTALLDFF